MARTIETRERGNPPGTSKKLDNWAENLLYDITEFFNQMAERKVVCSRSKVWWTEKIRGKKRIAKACCRRYTRIGDEIAKEEYKEVVRELRNEIRRPKLLCWNTFLEEATKADIWRATRYCRVVDKSTIPTLSWGQGRIASTAREKEEVLVE